MSVWIPRRLPTGALKEAAVREFDVEADDDRILHAYDVGPTGRDDELVLLWHHGTPNIGAPPEPLFGAAAALGLRWVGYDRPGYGGSDPRSGAAVASAANDAARVADHLGIDRLAVFGHSGGGPRAMACGACWGIGYFRSSRSQRLPLGRRMASTSSLACRLAASGNWEPRLTAAAVRWRTSWRPQTSTLSRSQQPTGPRSTASGPGSTALSQPGPPMGSAA